MLSANENLRLFDCSNAVIDQRYFCVNPQNPIDEDEILKQIQHASFSRSAYSALFYKCSSSVTLNNLQMYKNANIIPMEVSSGLTILLLDLQKGDDYLDLCCAPGSKLCLAGCLLGGSGSITGIDISKQRLCNARSLAKKYRLGNVRLFLGDACKFNIPVQVPSIWSQKINTIENKTNNVGGFKLNDLYAKNNFEKPFYSSSVYRKQPSAFRGSADRLDKDTQCASPDPTHYGYNKILVDAECTHDGSIKHLIKNSKNKAFDVEKYFGVERLEHLASLQLKLLKRGFELLRPGGTLIYSTCSLMECQNEWVINEFFAQQLKSQIEENQHPQLIEEFPQVLNEFVHIEKDTGRRYLKFNPSTNQMSGFFIAKIKKKPVKSQ